MNHHKLLQVIASVTLAVLFLVGCGAPVATPTPVVIVVTATPQATPTHVVIVVTATPQPTPTPVPSTPTPVPPTAIVVNTSGEAYKVTDLYARYRATGTWIPRAPQVETDDLYFYLEQDPDTTIERFSFPFASLQRVVFKGAFVPEELKGVFEGQEPIRIELRDGTLILLSNTLLVEMDAEGTQTEILEMDRYSFRSGQKSNGQKHLLRGFGGLTITESGEESDFWISLYHTRSIEFEEP